MRASGVLGVPHKGPKHGLTVICSELHAGAAAPKASETYGEELNCQASGKELEGQLSPRQKCWQRPLFLC